MTPNIEVIVGTYEEFLLGYKLEKKNDKDVLIQTFADKSHCGSIKCLAVRDRWVATGSADDRVFIYDMRIRKQTHILLAHDGSINALAFTPDSTHLLSGSDDGQMIATRLTTWFTEATWKKAHNGAAVTHISCHPSGKLALSLGADLVLRTWNLVKGRMAYKTNLKSRNTLGPQPDCLAWSTDGDYFSICGHRVVELWSIKTAEAVHSQKTVSKPVSVCWIAKQTCLVGLEDGQIIWITFNEKEVNEIAIKAHTTRVKTMAFQSGILVTASSCGEVKQWLVNEGKKKLLEVASVNIGCRPTCIGILDLDQFGPDYKIGSTVVVKQETTKKHAKPTQKQRGVVTIEYEDEDRTDNAVAQEDDEDAKSDEESKEKESDVADNDDEEASDSETANDSSDEDDDAEAEPQIRLPKSRKRKQQMLETQQKAQAKMGAKKPKSNVSKSESKEPNENLHQQKKRKQKKNV